MASDVFAAAGGRLRRGGFAARLAGARLGLRDFVRFMMRSAAVSKALLRKMTRHLPVAKGAERRHAGLAGLGAARAAAIETADIGVGVDGAARLAGEPEPLAAVLMQARHRRNERLGVGM